MDYQDVYNLILQITNDFRRYYKVKIHSQKVTDRLLLLTMENEYIKIGRQISLEELQLNAFNLEDYWKNILYSMYITLIQELKEKAYRVMGWS